MPDTITFVLPGLFEPRFQNLVNENDLTNSKQLSSFISKSKKQPFQTIQQWLTELYNLPDNYQNSASLMAQAQGLTTHNEKEQIYWLRADPVMLTVGHNGLFCRGNRVLQLTDNERDSLQLLVNEYFYEQSIEMILPDSKHGYIKSAVKPLSTFTSMDDAIGNEISQLLPSGEDAAFWHGVLTDLQMLLHNCEVNQKRQSKGLPTISGFWLWAEAELIEKDFCIHNVEQELYTDDPALSGFLGCKVNLHELGVDFNDLHIGNKPITVFVSELQQVCSQNDEQGWLQLYQHWVNNWLLLAVDAVNKKNCKAVRLITDDGFCYQYNSLSQWCFWR